LMLARALLAKPNLLCLEEPYEGLDRAATAQIAQVLAHYAAAGQRMVLMLSQQQDIPEWATHWALLEAGLMAVANQAEVVQQHPLWHAWRNPKPKPPMSLPPRQSKYQLPDWPADQPLMALRNGEVVYGDRVQFSGLDWSLWPGQHTQLIGPNGCGKSTLLKLVTGDHPQCYSNDLSVVGYRRGQGESIWDIKKHIGFMSGDLIRDYRVAGNVLTAVISGLTDSIGLYQPTGAHERQLALDWLDCMGLAEQALRPLRSLSTGEQRLVLLARALIKQPPLLVLDEPTSGLDDWHRFHFLNMVAQLLEGGPTTLLWVSHRADEQLSLLKRQLVFTPGEGHWNITEKCNPLGVCDL
jgi:molybdate transport system ATP-binding protein